ncbi:MAG: YfiR family protein [Syntrophomonadaceae bacterium]
MKNIPFQKRKVILFVACFIIAAASNIFAQDMSVPGNLQAALFKKIFAFDKTLRSKGNIEVVVLAGDGSGDAIVSDFKAAGVNARSVKGNQVPSGASVIYLMPGVGSTKQQSAQKGVLSITGVASYVNDGKAAIGIGIEGGKPKIIINMGQLKAEGQEVSADLLQIARVIQ